MKLVSPTRGDWLWVGALLAIGVADWIVAVDRLDHAATALTVIVAGSLLLLARPASPVGIPLGVAIAAQLLDPVSQVAEELVWSVAVYLGALVLAGVELRGARLAAAVAALFAADDVSAVLRGFPEGYWNDTAWSLAAIVPAVAAGRIVGSQRELAAALAERNAELESERERLAEAARAEERARIARELHDVVAHSVSVMVVQAGAARTVRDTDVARAAASFRLVRATGAEALTEMDWLVGVLDSGASRADEQPGVARVQALVDRAREAGLPVTFREEGERRPLDAERDVAAYRVVQQALTNVLKHAHGAPTAVSLQWSTAELVVDVVDGGGVVGAIGGSGHGIAGMRERLEVLGGALDAGARAAGGFAVHARLPLAEVLA